MRFGAPLLATVWVLGLVWLTKTMGPGKSYVGVLLFWCAVSFALLAFLMRSRSHEERPKRERQARTGAPPPPSPIRLLHTRPAVSVSPFFDRLLHSAVLIWAVGGVFIGVAWFVIFTLFEGEPLSQAVLLTLLVAAPGVWYWRQRRRDDTRKGD